MCNSLCIFCNSSRGTSRPSFARLVNWFTLFPIALNCRANSNAPSLSILGGRIRTPCAFFLQKVGTLIPASFAICSSFWYSRSSTRNLICRFSFLFSPKKDRPSCPIFQLECWLILDRYTPSISPTPRVGKLRIWYPNTACWVAPKPAFRLCRATLPHGKNHLANVT